MQEISYVYILASGFKHLYIGVTTEIESRIVQHKNNTYPNSFTARYNIKNLVYFERFADSPRPSPVKNNSSAGPASKRLR